MSEKKKSGWSPDASSGVPDEVVDALREQIERERSGKDAEAYFAPATDHEKTMREQRDARAWEEEIGWQAPGNEEAQRIAAEAGLGMFEPGPEERLETLRNTARLDALSAELSNVVRLVRAVAAVTLLGFAIVTVALAVLAFGG